LWQSQKIRKHLSTNSPSLSNGQAVFGSTLPVVERVSYSQRHIPVDRCTGQLYQLPPINYFLLSAEEITL
jgi:hypothetical protein